MRIYYFFAIVAIWFGIQSLISGLRFASYVRRECARGRSDFLPFASVIVPCRGLNDGLTENLATIFNQDYPAYEIVFVTGDENDPCVGVIEGIRNRYTSRGIPSRLVFAGKARDSGQKVHNLRRAVMELDPRSEVLVFVDADARPAQTWLRSLVGPLADEQLGATTGYRWFLSAKGGITAQLLSVWNASIASALGEREDKNFCWGGSTAIRRATFERLAIRDRWQGTVSDDFTVMRVLQEARLPIKFVPACLTASLEDYNFRELLEFTTRQLQITRVYAPHFWRAALLGGLLFNSVFFGGLVLIVMRVILGLSYTVTLVLVITMFLLGAAKAYIRWRAVGIPLANYRRELRKSLLAHVLLWPLGAVLFFYNSLVAAFSRRIRWRGIGYELKSPTEAVIISQD